MPLTKCSSASWSTSGLAVLPGGRSFGGHGSLLALASVAGGGRGVALGWVTLAVGRCALVRAVSLGGRASLGRGTPARGVTLGRGALGTRVGLGRVAPGGVSLGATVLGGAGPGGVAPGGVSLGATVLGGAGPGGVAPGGVSLGATVLGGAGPGGVAPGGVSLGATVLGGAGPGRRFLGRCLVLGPLVLRGAVLGRVGRLLRLGPGLSGRGGPPARPAPVPLRLRPCRGPP